MNWNFYWATPKEMNTFWKAINRGDLKTVRRLISTNPKMLRWERGDGLRPLDLYAVAARPNHKILDLLLSLESNALGLEADPVLAASREGNSDTLQALIRRRLDPNGRRCEQFETPLHAAVEEGHDKPIKMLLAAGADPGIENCDGVTPLELAEELRMTSCIALLKSHPLKRRTPFVNPRIIKQTIKLNLLKDLSTIRSMIKKGIRAAKAKKLSKEITAVVLHGSGYQGFVEFGCETKAFDHRKPDCGADVTMGQLARCEFSQWRRAYIENNRVIVLYGEKKPSTLTSRATCEKKDEPFFRFLKSVLKNAIKDGDFTELPLAADCFFGVQTYFHHHCEFWDKNGKKAMGPST